MYAVVIGINHALLSLVVIVRKGFNDDFSMLSHRNASWKRKFRAIYDVEGKGL